MIGSSILVDLFDLILYKKHAKLEILISSYGIIYKLLILIHILFIFVGCYRITAFAN